jgi:hypothetical protein
MASGAYLAPDLVVRPGPPPRGSPLPSWLPCRSSSFVVVVVVPPFAVGCAGWLVWLGTVAAGHAVGSRYLVENSKKT